MTNAELLAKIKAEIERLAKRADRRTDKDHASHNAEMERYGEDYWNGYGDLAYALLSFLSALESEKPMNKDCNDCPHCVDRKDQYGWHFKGCFGGPYNGKFIAEIDECPLKQEQPEVDLEKASRNVYESWMGGTMDDVRRDMVELGKVLNARKV